MFIGLISDTHGVFTSGFRKFFEPVDEIWHAGDFGGGAEFVETLTSFKPVVGVYGNCDGQDIRREYPLFQYMNVEGLNVMMTHIGGSPGHYEPSVRELIRGYHPDIFICGHSHILRVMNDRTENLLYINPGAAGYQGWQQKRTALRFRIEKGEIKNMEVFELPRDARNG